MAYQTPRTWVAGEYPTAAQYNQDIRDNQLAAFPLGVDAWTSYVPTLTQGGAVAKTVTYGKYMRVGRLVTVNVQLTCSGAGTGATAIIFGLPVPTATMPVNQFIGIGGIFDTSATSWFKGAVALGSSTTAYLLATNTTTAGVLGNETFIAALAAGDLVTFSATYEAAT